MTAFLSAVAPKESQLSIAESDEAITPNAPQATDWNRRGVALPDDYPAPVDMPADRITHTLDGDHTGGGHRHGTGRPGKSEFPADWPDSKITDAAVDISRNPDHVPTQGYNLNWRVFGTRDGVPIPVIMKPDGTIWTAHLDSPTWPRNPMGRRDI